MILMKRLSAKEVLEVLSELITETLPEGVEGRLSLEYDDDGGVEVYFIAGETQAAN